MGSLKPRDAVLIDTNVLIDYIDGFAQARKLLTSVVAPAISVVTWIEVLAAARSADEARRFRSFLDAWHVIALDAGVADGAAAIRRERRLKLPDAIILATAQRERRKLVTRNSKDFDVDDPDVVVPYRLNKPKRT